MPAGATVQVFKDKIAYDKSGKEYTRVGYNGQYGYVKSAYIQVPVAAVEVKGKSREKSLDDDAPPARDAPRYKPKAGFELEFTKVYVLPRQPKGQLTQALLKSANDADTAAALPGAKPRNRHLPGAPPDVGGHHRYHDSRHLQPRDRRRPADRL
jgi:hypothetical protein